MTANLPATRPARPRRGPDPATETLLRPIGPYVHAFMTTSMRVSNAKATSELPWAPSMTNCQAGIRATAASRR